MAVALKRFAGPVLAVLALLAAGAAMLVGWHRYERDYAVTVEEDGSAVTRVIAERFAGASSLKVSELSGTIQSTAQDVRGFGLLQGVELVKDRETRAPDAETGRAITNRCMELGLSMNIVSVGKMAAIWRVAPPLTVSREEIDRGVAIIDQAIGEVLAEGTK